MDAADVHPHSDMIASLRLELAECGRLNRAQHDQIRRLQEAGAQAIMRAEAAEGRGAKLEAERDTWIEKCKTAVWSDSEMCKLLEAKVAEWKQIAQVEAGLRREFLERAEKAEAERDQYRHQAIGIKPGETMDERRARHEAWLAEEDARIKAALAPAPAPEPLIGSGVIKAAELEAGR